MTIDEVQKLCPRAENITITGSTVAMKVGEFAQARNLDLSHNGNPERQIRDLYLDLQAQNRELQSQLNDYKARNGVNPNAK